MLLELRFQFTEVEPSPARHLDLQVLVEAPPVPEHALRVDEAAITCPVTRVPSEGNELAGGEVRAIEISLAHSQAPDDNLAHHPVRQRSLLLVEDADPGVLHGATDGKLLRKS